MSSSIPPETKVVTSGEITPERECLRPWQNVILYDAKGLIAHHFLVQMSDESMPQLTLGDIKALCPDHIDTSQLVSVKDEIHCTWCERLPWGKSSFYDNLCMLTTMIVRPRTRDRCSFHWCRHFMKTITSMERTPALVNNEPKIDHPWNGNLVRYTYK